MYTYYVYVYIYIYLYVNKTKPKKPVEVSLGGAAHKAKGPALSWPERVQVATVGWPRARSEEIECGKRISI